MHPTLFEIGTTVVPSYGFFLTLGCLAGLTVILLLAGKQGLPLAKTAAYGLFGLAACILGGKLYLIFLGAGQGLISVVRPWTGGSEWTEGGGSFYGGIIAGIVFSLWYLRRTGLPFWKVADIAGTGIALGYSLMRIGCFLGGCCYGRPTSLPWGVRFPHQSEAVHPTQLYESGLNLAGFFILLAVLRKKRFDGQVISLAIWINCSVRFVVEYLRGDPGRGWLIQGGTAYASLTTPQFICLIGILTGSILFTTLRRRLPDPA